VFKGRDRGGLLMINEIAAFGYRDNIIEEYIEFKSTKEPTPPLNLFKESMRGVKYVIFTAVRKLMFFVKWDNRGFYVLQKIRYTVRVSVSKAFQRSEIQILARQ
jgi:hypothetical protein